MVMTMRDHQWRGREQQKQRENHLYWGRGPLTFHHFGLLPSYYKDRSAPYVPHAGCNDDDVLLACKEIVYYYQLVIEIDKWISLYCYSYLSSNFWKWWIMLGWWWCVHQLLLTAYQLVHLQWLYGWSGVHCSSQNKYIYIIQSSENKLGERVMRDVRPVTLGYIISLRTTVRISSSSARPPSFFFAFNGIVPVIDSLCRVTIAIKESVFSSARARASRLIARLIETHWSV